MTQKTTEGGFTLIEVILFLAIAGLMLSGVLIGVSGSINRQRYEDSVVTLRDYLQGQYNLVDNVRNNRPESIPCTAPGGIALSGPAQPRGTSECAVVGRLVSSSNGIDISSKPVFATSANYVTDGSEQDLLNSLGLEQAPGALATDDDDYSVAWGARIYTNPSSPTTSRQFSLLILRLPNTGLIRTYTSTSSVTNLSSFWSGTPANLPLCLEPGGIDIAGGELGVRVLANSTSSAGVQRITSGEGQC